MIRLTVITSPGSGGWFDLRCNGLYHENSHNLSMRISRYCANWYLEDEVVDEELIGLRLGVLLPVIYCEKYAIHRRS